jgi:dTDP-4-dehydrorhamnose 3,5-epimerase-like enzyme
MHVLKAALRSMKEDIMNYELLDFKIMGDERGSLIALEENDNVPFPIKRVYYIFGTKENVRRGFHAHKALKQLAICVRGSCRFLLDDGNEKEYITLNSPDKGLLLDGLIWREMFDFSPDCVLMVVADAHYNESDYIRDYSTFQRAVHDTSDI